MVQVISNQTLANGLRAEFDRTYLQIENRRASAMLASVMDLSISATNRKHEFAYFNAAPHMAYWQRGDSIPTDAFDSVQFSANVWTWGRRVPWHKEDRKDDQTQSLMEMARRVGASAALLPEIFFFDLITSTASTLPVIPLAPDGAAMYANTANGEARFGVTGGNLLTGSGVATTSQIRNDFYNAVEQFMQFQDGKGQPLFLEDVTAGGVIIAHAATNTEAFHETFLQQRQSVVAGTDAGTTPTSLTQDAGFTIDLWPTQRLTGNDWFIFARNSPMMPTFLLDREGVREFSSLEGDNNGDHTRTTGEEYVQWERRAGAGIALPYGTIMINN